MNVWNILSPGWLMIWNYVHCNSLHFTGIIIKKIYLKGEIYNPGHNNNCWIACWLLAIFLFNVNVDKVVRSKQTCQTIPKNTGKIKINWNKELTTTCVHTTQLSLLCFLEVFQENCITLSQVTKVFFYQASLSYKLRLII